jgi:hypothetical protein
VYDDRMPSNSIESIADIYVPKAFPSSLSVQATSTANLIPAYPHRLWTYDVVLDREVLAIPVRLYFPRAVLQAPPPDDDIAYTMLLCLGTRHHDGFVREECVSKLLKRGYGWTVPFIVQLLGEYVVEITQVISDALPHVDMAPYVRFIAENEGYMETTGRRITSYWSCYYRHVYPERATYPPRIVFDYLKKLADHPAFRGLGTSVRF